jgi:hypothetical protein
MAEKGNIAEVKDTSAQLPGRPGNVNSFGRGAQIQSATAGRTEHIHVPID